MNSTTAPKIALIGCGIWGRNILRDLLALKCNVIVVETSENHRQEAMTMGAQSTLNDIGKIPAVDGIVVATPATTHSSVLRHLIEREVPIFCEKPFTTDLEEARALAEVDNGRLFVMHIWRYHPAVQALSDIARDGELGSVEALRTTRTNWTSPRTDTDSIWTLIPHDLTIALAILGSIPVPRYAVAESAGDRTVGMIAVMGDRPWFVLEGSNRYQDKRREIRLHCSEGVAVFPGQENGYIEIVRGEGLEPAIERRELADTPALKRELHCFVEHLRGGPAPPSGIAEAVSVVEKVVELRRMAGIKD